MVSVARKAFDHLYFFSISFCTVFDMFDDVCVFICVYILLYDIIGADRSSSQSSLYRFIFKDTQKMHDVSIDIIEL